jgi:hypothetical protein
MGPHRSRIEVFALWAQLVLVFADVLAVAEGAVAVDEPGNGHGWVVYLSLLCALPAAAAFRATRAAAHAMLWTASLAFFGCFWFDGMHLGSVAYALSLTWPLLGAAALLWFARNNRRDREREASLLHTHTRGNRLELEESEVCGCLACERIYSPTEVVRFSPGESAECPYCGIGAVVGSASGIPITPAVLARAHARWFLLG